MKSYDYSRVIGHSLICDKLRQAVAGGRTVSAYLLTGSPGIGKKTVALSFAAALLCESPRAGEACGVCSGCRLLAAGNHPDLIRPAVPPDKKSVGVELVREQVIQEAYVRPFHAARKVFLLENSELLTVEAQNALLKILEEPPAYAVFLLLATAPDQLLETVLSRCLKLQLLPLPAALCRTYFSGLSLGTDSRRALAAAFSQGVLGRGLRLLQDEAYYELYQTTIARLAALAGGGTALVDLQQFLVQYRDAITDVIDFMLIFLRDCLRTGISRQADLICADQKDAVSAFCTATTPKGLVHMMEAVIRFRERLQKNASFTVAGLELLTRLQEEIHD